MGKEYAKTRHNVGVMCLDYIARKHNISFKEKVNNDYFNSSLFNKTIILVIFVK